LRRELELELGQVAQRRSENPLTWGKLLTQQVACVCETAASIERKAMLSVEESEIER